MAGAADVIDVIVIGSGAGGLSAAVTAASAGLSVTVVERASVLGGASAWSGGWMWLPRTALARQIGIDEPRDAPRAYLQAVLGDRFDAARVDAFLDAAPTMVDFFHGSTALQFECSGTICDIYGDLPGAGTGGRSLIAAPYDARALGPRLGLLRRPMAETALWGMPIMAGKDLAAFLSATRSPRSFLHVAKRILRHWRDLIVHGRAMQLVNGSALIGRLIASARDVGVTFITDCRATALSTDEDNMAASLLVEQAGQTRRLSARRAVVLATGGFPHNAALRAALFPGDGASGAVHWSVAPPEADGAGLALAQSCGGVLDASGAAAGAWCPVSVVPYADGSTGHFPHIIERAKPGLIAVRADGRRFVNEADGYHDYVAALFAATPEGEEAASWLICDHAFQRRWGLGISRPFPFPVGRWLRNGYLKRGATVAELAAICGIDAAGLVNTVARTNASAATGDDLEFGRGSTPYNRSQGDPQLRPNPNVRPIGNGPYYAVKVLPGSFGTFAGIKTDQHARVLHADGSAIPGLYVAGNDMASVMGGHYLAGGINLGPAMTFGYIAGRHIAGEADVAQASCCSRSCSTR